MEVWFGRNHAGSRASGWCSRCGRATARRDVQWRFVRRKFVAGDGVGVEIRPVRVPPDSLEVRRRRQSSTMPVQTTIHPRRPRSIDGVFRALADPTRRKVVERLSRGSASVSELARPFDMALPSFLEHLRVLEECGLANSQKTGRVRTYRLAPKRLKLAQDWLARRRAEWEQRLDQLDQYLTESSDT